ncbi:MAG: class I SAM-dependent methyltransferase [Acidimicrobiales bacterium]|nr:class I SAM-dependent methyltransferase [Acidimicrobiales bacterium]
MLTVDYDRLRLEPGHLVLDMGAGAGRHAFEAYRRGARVVALDYGFGELPEVMSLFAAMSEAGEAGDRPDSLAAAVNGDGTRLPFPDATFDRIICSEVLEHIPDHHAALRELRRVLKPDGILAATVPTWFPEQVCWKLSEEYHAPFVEGGHVRIFREGDLRRAMRAAGFRPGTSHHAHALHSPYWWLKCAVGPTNDEHPAVKAYHRLLVWDITSAPKLTRWTEKVLNPVLGKSLVVYAHAGALPDRPRVATAPVEQPSEPEVVDARA